MFDTILIPVPQEYDSGSILKAFLSKRAQVRRVSVADSESWAAAQAWAAFSFRFPCVPASVRLDSLWLLEEAARGNSSRALFLNL
jgi:hypothetical protein